MDGERHLITDGGAEVAVEQYLDGFHVHSLRSDGSDPTAVFRLVAKVLELCEGAPLYINDSESDPRMMPYYARLGFKKAYTVYKRDGVCNKATG